MNYLKRLRRLALPLALAGVQAMTALASGFVLLVPNLQAFGIIFAVGYILIAVRVIFLWMVPVLCRLSGVLTVCINALMLAVAAIVDLIIMAIYTIEEIVHTLMAGAGSRPKMGKFMAPPQLDDHEVKSFLQTIASRCSAYDGFVSIWNFVVKSVASPTVCPVIRATFPLQAASGINWYTVTNTTLGWMSYPAEPHPGGNCDVLSGPPDFVCVGLGTGYIVLELLLPTLIVGIFLYSAAGSIWALVYRAIAAIWKLGLMAIGLAFTLLEKL